MLWAHSMFLKVSISGRYSPVGKRILKFCVLASFENLEGATTSGLGATALLAGHVRLLHCLPGAAAAFRTPDLRPGAGDQVGLHLHYAFLFFRIIE